MIVNFGGTYFMCTESNPLKGQRIIVQNPDNSFILNIANKDLSEHECFRDNKRYIWTIKIDTVSFNLN